MVDTLNFACKNKHFYQTRRMLKIGLTKSNMLSFFPKFAG